MGYLTNQKQDGIKMYDVLFKDVEGKLLRVSDRLNIDRFVFEKRTRSSITYYDTPDHLLTKTGILLYKTYENGEFYFKVEKLNFLPSVSKVRHSSVFENKCEARDTPRSQAFYLINGITALFSTHFNIDLENVLKFAYPTLHVDIQGSQFKGFNANGFKCVVEFQNVLYTNYLTKRKNENLELMVLNTSSQAYEKDFEDFVVLLERYCKGILPKDSLRYDYGQRITRILPKVKKEKGSKKKKPESKPQE